MINLLYWKNRYCRGHKTTEQKDVNNDERTEFNYIEKNL